MTNYPTSFISYSWEDDEHKKWVKDLASRLRQDGVDVRLDLGYVSGNKIILERTTIEEVKEIHKDTLKLVVEAINKQYIEIILKDKLKKEIEEQERIRHQNNIRNIANDIDF